MSDVYDSAMNLLVDRMFRHMAWANNYVFDRMAELSDADLQLTAPNDDWTAVSILEHLTGSRYADLLDGLGYTETVVPTNSAEIRALKELSAGFDARLRKSAQEYEGFVEFKRMWSGPSDHAMEADQGGTIALGFSGNHCLF